MPFLKIVYLNGDVDQRPLEKQQPVSIGSHSSNDIRIDEEGVESLHCRVAWNKKAFEAVAAGVEGFEVNGNVVQRAVLKDGDVLRFGTVDLRFLEHEDQEAELPLVAATASPDSGSIQLKALSDELDVPDWLKGESEAKARPTPKAEPNKAAAEAPKPASRKPVVPEKPRAEASKPAEKGRSEKARSEKVEKPSKPKAPPPEDDEDFGEFDLDAGLEALAQESRSAMPTFEQAEEGPDTADYDQPVKSKSRTSKAPKAEAPAKEPEAAPAAPPEPAASAPVAPPREDKVRSALRHQRRSKPGEEDILRSPLVIGLASAAVISLLLAAIFYFVGFRRSIQEEFDFAKAQFTENKFPQAIEAFNLFLQKHGEHSLAPEAKRILGLATIDEQITGAAPKFGEGLKALKDFVAEQRDQANYAEQVQPDVAKRAGDIALGSAKAASRVFESSLLDVAKDAKSALMTASSKETPPTELIKEIDRNVQLSGAAILKHNTNNEQYKAIEAAIAANKPLDALRLRRELLARYPDLEADKKIVAITTATLDKERALVKEEVLDRPAATDPLNEPKSLTLVYQARTRTDQVSVNRAVPVLSHGTLFGIDTVTGGPIWKRAVGVDTPFFPVRDSATNSLIVFNSSRQEVMRIDQNTGNVLWRQPIEERASGKPLISEGQVFVPTVAGRLYRIELDSGTLVSRLTFSQAISNPVEVQDGAGIVVSGDREVFYTLTSRPFACAAVSYLGQPSQSIVAPLLALGPYVLAAQNLSNDAARLRLITTRPADQPLKEVASFEIPGHVVDAPVVRGRDLFVPSTNERVSAFQISDEMSQPPMVAGPRYEVKGAQPVVTHLSAAPDGQLFMASTAVRKLELKVDSLQPAQEAILLGKATQPLHYQDRLLFVARQRPFAESVVLTPIDRTSLAGDWQSIAGARIIAASVVSGENPSIVCVTESGQLFRVTAKALETGGFLSVAERVPLNDELVDPIVAASLGEGQLVVAAGLPEPKMWHVNRLGQIERTATLASPLQAAPAAMGNKVLAPVNGRLQLLQTQGGQPAAQEYRLPGDLAGSTKWVKVFAADADSGAGVLENGTVVGVRLQKSPQPHLMESGRYSLEAPLVGRPHFDSGKLAVAGSNGRVAVIAVENLEPRGETAFGGPIAAGPWVAGDLVFVEPGDGTLQARTIARDLPATWTLPLPNDHLAGAPVVRGSMLLIPLQSGRVLRCDVATGELKGTADLQVALAGSPLAIGNALYLTTLDGGLIRLPEDVQ
jgi:outer membrane protein assembly factor BamB